MIAAETALYLVLIFSLAADALAGNLFATFLQEERGLAVAAIGSYVSLFGLISLLARVPGGLLYSPRTGQRVQTLSLAAMALALIGYSVVPGATALIPLIIIHSLAFSLVSTINLAFFMDIMGKRQQAANAMAWYAAANSAGYALGNLSSGWLADTLGYAAVFRVGAGFAGLALLSLAVCRPAVLAAAAPAGPTGLAELKAELRRRLGAARDLSILAAALLMFSNGALSQVVYYFFPLYARAAGLSLTSIGLMKGVNAATGTVMRPLLSGRLVARIGHRRIEVGGILVFAAVSMAIPGFTHWLPLGIILVLLGSIRGVVVISNYVAIHDCTASSPERRGMASALVNLGQDLGKFVGPAVAGALGAAFTVPTIFLVAPVLLASFHVGALRLIQARAAAQAAEPVEPVLPGLPPVR